MTFNINSRSLVADCFDDTQKFPRYGIEVKGEDGSWFELRDRCSYDKATLKTLAISLGYTEYRLITK